MISAVVVPTYGRGELLDRCLASLAALDPAPTHVIVVDGNESPMAAIPTAPQSMMVIREPNQGAAHARNVGYREARRLGADLVCFIDDDAIAPPDWYGRHVALHREHPDAGVIGGGISNLYPASL